MRTLFTVFATAGLLFTNFAHAASPYPGQSQLPLSSGFGLDLSLSNETANLESLTPVRRFTRGQRGGQLEATGLISVGVFYNDLDDVVVHGKLVAVGEQTATRVPYQLEFGAKAYTGKVKQDETNVGALAIGGGIKIQNPRRFNPIDLKVEAFFTPGITTFGDTDSMLEINARLSLEIVPAAHAFLGYRLLEVENDSHMTLELDDNVHMGFRMQF